MNERQPSWRRSEDLLTRHLRLYPLPAGYRPVPAEELRPSVRQKRATAINKADRRRDAKREALAERKRQAREARRKADTRTTIEKLLATDPVTAYLHGPDDWRAYRQWIRNRTNPNTL